MKRWIGTLLLWLLLASTACAQTYTFSDPEHSRAIYTCEDFAGELPSSAQLAFADVLREGDEIICGTIIEETWEGLEGEQGGSAMMAIRRGGNMLLLGATYDNKRNAWRSGVESDRFLPENAEFSMTAAPDYTRSGMLRFVYMVLVCGNEKLAIRSSTGGMLNLCEYIRDEVDGTQTVAGYDDGLVDWGKRTQGKKDVVYGYAGPIPSRLCAWTYDTLPRSLEESRAWTAPFSFALAGDEGYITGVNFRERPTGQSKSFGIYRAKVRVLGQKPGTDVPWYNVRVGNLTGWVSGRYLETALAEDRYRLATCQTTVGKVGRAKGDVQLLDKPGGDAVTTLDEGALVHVLMDNEGYLHVIVPRGELTWQTDWDGTYGFVKSEDMVVGISEADVMWRERE